VLLRSVVLRSAEEGRALLSRMSTSPGGAPVDAPGIHQHSLAGETARVTDPGRDPDRIRKPVDPRCRHVAQVVAREGVLTRLGRLRQLEEQARLARLLGGPGRDPHDTER